jgi:predicted PurR-regulated permease PerM
MSNIKKIILIIVPLIIFVALLFLAIYLGWDGVFLGPSATIFAVIITINYTL